MEFKKEDLVQLEDLVEFQHSFGYDCKKYFNLCVADESTVLFASGNLIHFLNLNTGDVSFRRGVHGGGIGHIAKNPVLPHIAVSETGTNSAITIHDWPSFEIICVLKSNESNPVLHTIIVFSNGKGQFRFLEWRRSAYCRLVPPLQTGRQSSPDGQLLCSQDGTPGYTLKVWNWKESKIILQKISNNAKVANILFSPYIPGQFASSGIDHIIFWKIARTFTGLKLIKNVGRFGEMEPTKIIGLLPLQDEKVVSGCQWGNILVWEQGHIKLEVLRKNAPVCHTAPITQFEYNNGELMSVGLDGKIKIWYFETIDEANPPEDNKVLRIEPIYEFQIGPNDNPVQLMSILKRRPENSLDSHWVAQDGNGGIWKVHLDLGSEAVPSRQCLHCHAGPIMDLACSPQGNLIVSIGRDGRIILYDFLKNKLLLQRQFSAEGSCIIWFSKNVEPSGKCLLAAFHDGALRMMQVQSKKSNGKTGSKNSQFITLIQVIKPHSQPITALTINKEENIIVSGSEDATIFIHLIVKEVDLQLVPIGFVRVSSEITFLSWKPREPKTILVCCRNGRFEEIDLLTNVPPTTAITYEIQSVKRKSFNFEPQASRLERVLFAAYTEDGTIWLSMAGRHAGYLHEYDFERGHISQTKICDSEDSEITSYAYFADKSYLILGLSNGHISINLADSSDFRSLQKRQSMAMHDERNGIIRRLCISNDQKYLFSCGDDGNIFSFLFKPNELCVDSGLKEDELYEEQPITSVKDIKEKNAFSLEDMKLKIYNDRKMLDRSCRMSEVKKKMEFYKDAFRDIIQKNNKLPMAQRIQTEHFEIDGRVTEERNSLFKSEMSETTNKLAYMLEKSNTGLQKLNEYFLNMLDSDTVHVGAISIDLKVPTFRQRKLPYEFYIEKEMVRIKIQETQARDLSWSRIKSQEQERRFSIQPAEIVKKLSIKVDPFLMGVDVNVPEYKNNIKLHGIIDRFFMRRKKTQNRDEKLSEMMNVKPDPNENHPEDLAALETAKLSVGEYELKSAQGYCVRTNCRMTLLNKHYQLLDSKETIFSWKKKFNKKVLALREKRLRLIECIQKGDMNRKFNVKKMNEEPSQLQLAENVSPEPMKNGPEIFVLKSHCYDSMHEELCPENEKDSDDVSEYETEMKTMDLIHFNCYQNKLYCQISKGICDFDKEVKQLEEIKVKIAVDIKLLEIFSLQINRELIILQSFDQREELLLKDYYGILYDRYKTHDRILSLRVEIDALSQMVQGEEVYISELWVKFLLLSKDSRFSNNLKRAYRKKYMPPDFENDWQSSSSEESSSSDESSGSEKMLPNERRESQMEGIVGHEDMEKKLMEQTMTLRAERYQMQASINEKTKRMECLKRECEKCQKKEETIDRALEARKSILTAFQNERQQALNNMEVIVVINAKQMDGISELKDFSGISDRLLFSQKALNQIIARVSDLNQESVQQHEIHRIYCKYLHRIKVECSQMKAKVITLKRETTACKKRKFGIEVQVEDLELALLKCKITDVQSSVNEYQKEQNNKVREMKNKLKQKQQEFGNIVKENTAKVNLLTTLQKDSNFLSMHLVHQAEKQKSALASPHSKNLHIFDTKRLQSYRQKQLVQITTLKKEVQMLGNKTSKRAPLATVLSRAYSQDLPIKGHDSYLLGKYDEESGFVTNIATDMSQDMYMDPSIDTSVGDSVSSNEEFIAMISVKERCKSLEDGINQFKFDRCD